MYVLLHPNYQSSVRMRYFQILVDIYDNISIVIVN